MADIDAAKSSDTYKKICARLREFNPPVMIEKHIADDPAVLSHLAAAKIDPISTHRNVLGGVDFVVKDREELLIALKIAKTGVDAAFEKGGTSPEDWKEHWALAMSFMATDGIGFRQPWRLFLNDRALRLADAQPPSRDRPEMNARFAANFGEDIRFDFSALHVAIAEFGTLKNPRTMCNIHVDETGIAMAGVGKGVTVTPNFAHHLLKELLFKSKLDGKLPDWFVDRFNINFFNPAQAFSKLGVSFDIAKGDTYRWTISGSWGLAARGGFEWSGTTNLQLTHDLLGGPKTGHKHNRR